MSRPRIEDIEVPASASAGDLATVVGGVLDYAPPSAGAPTGPAGGVLSGTYPNPGFAVDMATQAELDAVDAMIPVLASQLASRYQPLVMVTAGVPELTYDSDNNLLMVEVPNP